MVFIMLSSHMYAESKIEIKDAKIGFGNIYQLDGKNLMLNELDEILYTNPEAYEQIKKGKKPLYTGMGISFIGGGLIGGPLGASLASGEDINWTMIGIGVSTVFIGHLFGYWADKYYEKGVLIYNRYL